MIKKMRFLLFVTVALLAMTESRGQIALKKGSVLPIVTVNDSQYVFVLSWDTDSMKLRTKRVLMSAVRDWMTDGLSAPVVSVSASVTPTGVFSVTVTNPTTTPHIGLAMKAASAYTVLGNNTGSSAVPGYMSVTLASGMFANQGQTNYVLHGNSGGNPSWGLLNLTNEVNGVLASPSGGTDQSSYAVGDMLYASGTTTLSKLAIGTAGYVLKSVGGVPAWAAESVTATNAITFTNKRWTQRTATPTTTVSATPTFDMDSYDCFPITAQAVNITSITLSGTPVHGDVRIFELTAASGSVSITWPSGVVSSSVFSSIDNNDDDAGGGTALSNDFLIR